MQVSGNLVRGHYRRVRTCTWTHLADLPLPREVDPENPIAAHESDCHVFYMFNYPMTCGEELVFNPGTLACEPAENVADSRPECASASGA